MVLRQLPRHELPHVDLRIWAMLSHAKQVVFPPPYGGYDHNWALFGLGEDAANKTFIGSVSEECAILCMLPAP